MLTSANNLSARQRKSKWRAENNILLDIHSPKYDPMKDYDEAEKEFYIGQKSSERSGYISDTIDLRFEIQEAEIKRQKLQQEETDTNELSFIEDGEKLPCIPENDPDYVMLDQSIGNESVLNDSMQTRSGRILIIDEREVTGGETICTPKPVIRKVRDCTD